VVREGLPAGVEVEQALEALSAPELRAVLRGILDEVDEDVRTKLGDRLLAQATRGSSGWKPARPSPRIVADAQAFAEAARRVGEADPSARDWAHWRAHRASPSH
jgi:hypothetical protein